MEIKKAGHFYVYATPDTINDSGSTTIHVQAQDQNNENMSYSGKVQISALPSEYGHLGNSLIIPASMQKGGVKGKQETLQSVNVTKKKFATMGDSAVVVDYGTAQAGQVIFTADGIAPDSSISIAITVTAVDQTSMAGKGFFVIKGGVKIKMSIDPAEVRPLNTGGNNETTVSVLATKGDEPVSGIQIQLTSNGVENSGGHLHDGDRPVGTFSVSNGATGSDGKFVSTYTASEFGGIERIITSAGGTKDSVDLNVKVDSLVAFAGAAVTFSKVQKLHILTIITWLAKAR